MNILFFDTETNGKPINYRAPMTQVDNWPRVIQLAWQIADDKGEVLRDTKHLIKPDGWTIPLEDFWILHGYSTEQNEKTGIPLELVLDTFIAHVQEFQCDVMVAHNMAFDLNVLGAEMIRYGRKAGRKMTQICTMLHGTDVCRLPGPRGFKWPKLEELYQHLFNENFDGAHDAGNDVTACRKAFFEMLKRGVIGLPETIS